MHIFLSLLALRLFTATPKPTESRSITFYADGAVVELDATAANRYA